MSFVATWGLARHTPDQVLVVLHEPPLVNWGIRGGKAASDVDIGFGLKV